MKYRHRCRSIYHNIYLRGTVQYMGKRKKTVKKRKRIAMSTFALTEATDDYETEPLYQRKFGDGDMLWLADEYRKQSASDPSLTLEGFAIQHGMSEDEFRIHQPKLDEDMERPIVVWHGTSLSRAESILKEGFMLKARKHVERRMFFTRDIAIAREYAQRRAKSERDSPAIIQCIIDLNEYSDYQRHGHSIFAFKAECISSEVVRRVVGRKKEAREKPKKRKRNNTDHTDVALTYNSGRAAIAYWINGYLKLDDADKISENNEAVEKIKEWLDEQIDAGKFGEVSEDEIRTQVAEASNTTLTVEVR